MLRRLWRVLILCLTLSAAAHAQTAGIQIEHPWARASGGQTGVVYLTIKNAGAADDRLVAAASPVAAKSELHITINDNGVMKMRPLSAIDVKAGSEIVLKPTGMHLMLMGLKQPLKEGQSFPLTLTFEKAGKVDTVVIIEKAGSAGGHEHSWAA